ncbi:MAG: hypothetical protein ACREUY_09600 [Burkholderiales bacterium]
MIREKLLGGAHEFQAERGHQLPADLWVGPPPSTQSRGIGSTSEETGGISGELAMPAAARRSRSVEDTLEEPWRSLLRGILRKGNFIQLYGTVGTQPVLVRPAESRSYFIIQNTSIANTLFVAAGYGPVVVAGGATGFILQANGGNYEPSVIPQQDIWVSANAAGTQWVMAVVVA